MNSNSHLTWSTIYPFFHSPLSPTALFPVTFERSYTTYWTLVLNFKASQLSFFCPGCSSCCEKATCGETGSVRGEEDHWQQRSGALHSFNLKACSLCLLHAQKTIEAPTASLKCSNFLICVYVKAELSAKEPKPAIYLSPKESTSLEIHCTSVCTSSYSCCCIEGKTPAFTHTESTCWWLNWPLCPKGAPVPLLCTKGRRGWNTGGRKGSWQPSRYIAGTAASSGIAWWACYVRNAGTCWNWKSWKALFFLSVAQGQFRPRFGKQPTTTPSRYLVVNVLFLCVEALVFMHVSKQASSSSTNLDQQQSFTLQTVPLASLCDFGVDLILTQI